MTRTRTPAVAFLACTLLAACARESAPAGHEDVAPTPAAATPAPGADASPRASAASPPVATDARPLAGQAEAGVAARLGAPQACEAVATGRRCTYARGAEVLFVDGMADHIVIADLQGAPFAPATIARIGLAGAEPLEVGEDAIRWQNVGGMRAIVLERGADGRAGRFVIKVMSP